MNISLRIFGRNLLSCQFKKFLKIDSSRIVIINFCQHLVDEFVLSFKPEFLESSFEFWRINSAWFIVIKNIKSLLMNILIKWLYFDFQYFIFLNISFHIIISIPFLLCILLLISSWRWLLLFCGSGHLEDFLFLFMN